MRERQKRFLRCSSNFFRRKTSTYLPWSVYFKLFMEFVAHDKVVCHTEPVRLHRVVGTVVHGTDLRVVKVTYPILRLLRHRDSSGNQLNGRARNPSLSLSLSLRERRFTLLFSSLLSFFFLLLQKKFFFFDFPVLGMASSDMFPKTLFQPKDFKREKQLASV